MKNTKEKVSFWDRFSNKKQRLYYFSERSIRMNDNRDDYPNNVISTSKYNIVNFIPKNLFFQFTKLANIYFVIIGLLQLIKEISTSRGVPYIFVPLTVIVAVTMVKDFVEDYKRHQSDWEENNKKTMVYQNGRFAGTKWQDLRVGNVVMVEENQYFPADLLLVYSSGKKGACYIETKNLDGETNLKQKQVHKDMIPSFDTEKKIGEAHHLFKYEKPNDYLYKFVGSLEMPSGETIPLGEQNFILRGCSLKNTEYVIGVVAYTGHHTKIMLNSIKAKPKLSKLEKMMNTEIILVFLVQLCFCIFSAFYAAVFYAFKRDELTYLGIDQSEEKDNAVYYNLFVRLGNWLLLFTNFVPISLLVTLEMVKLFQGIFMTRDPKMTSDLNQAKTTVQSSNLIEQLGQIEYIFSDKTGTLTQNLMEFKNLSVGPKSYGDARTLKDKKGMPEVTNVDFLDQGFFDELNNPNAPNHNNIVECLTLLAVCHTIITEEKHGQMSYNAASPDELALVNFAKFVGAEFLGIDEENNISINLKGQRQKFQLLHVLEFNSTRKRMSVIVKNPDGKIVLYTKGADTVLFGLMQKDEHSVETNSFEITQEHLQKYAVKGLRTLLLARRTLDQMLYYDWAKRYHDATVQIEGRDEAMETLQAEIEQNLMLVGATAIEDKLQDEVGLTISKLKEAGIKVWVLTGDKVETAVNIGYSCKLLNDNMIMLEILERTYEEVRETIDQKTEIIRSFPRSASFALIISGDALLHAMRPELAKKFLKIAEVCNSVLACRVSPKQKQEIVSLVRHERPMANTLAIGDGANDVYMISAANVGVGIKGVEGQQAARASDFAIGEFKILRRLVYYYGREAYRKNSHLVLYNFYKNIVLVLPQFWFGFVSTFSGQIIYEQKVFQFFNILFSSMPIIIYAVFDKEYDSKTLMNTPQLYEQGLDDRLFNKKKFWLWFFLGVWESFVISLFSFGAMDYNFTAGAGRMIGFYGPGMLVFSMAVWITNFKVLTISNQYNFLNMFFIIGSMLAYVFVFWLVGIIFKSELGGLFNEIFAAGNFYFASIIAVIVCFSFSLPIPRYFAIKERQRVKFDQVEQDIQALLQKAPKVPMEKSKGGNGEEEFSLEDFRAGSGASGKHYTGFAYSAPEHDSALLNARG